MRLDSETKKILKDPKLRWDWIKYQLNMANLSLRQLALSQGVRPQTINKCRHAPYPKMEKVIADALSVEPKELFPDRYFRNGLPNRGVAHKAAC